MMSTSSIGPMPRKFTVALRHSRANLSSANYSLASSVTSVCRPLGFDSAPLHPKLLCSCQKEIVACGEICHGDERLKITLYLLLYELASRRIELRKDVIEEQHGTVVHECTDHNCFCQLECHRHDALLAPRAKCAHVHTVNKKREIVTMRSHQ